MIALLLPHAGVHAAQHAPLLACLPPVFRRAVAAVLRKPAVPAGDQPAGAATPPDGLPVLGDRMLSEARAHADAMHAGYARAVDRLRADAGLPAVEEMRGEYFALPRCEPMRREPGKPPWRTMAHPVYGQACTADVLAAEALPDELFGAPGKLRPS